jgi:hypothetical protein
MVASLKLGLTADWVCREKEEGQSTCQAVTKLANKSAVSMSQFLAAHITRIDAH